MPQAPEIRRRWVRLTLGTMFFLVAAFVALFAGRYYYVPRSIPWQEYSPDEVRRATFRGNDVLVSFTADWDMTTATLHRLIDTPEVYHAALRSGTILMRADCSTWGPEVSEALSSLNQTSIPLIVIYRASSGETIIFDHTHDLPDAVVAALLAGQSKR